MITDLLFDELTGDLVIGPDNDLAVGESTGQHQQDIILSAKGHLKFAPVLGVGLTGFLSDQTTLPGLSGQIRVELDRDGQDVNHVAISNDGQIAIDAYYK